MSSLQTANAVQGPRNPSSEHAALWRHEGGVLPPETEAIVMKRFLVLPFLALMLGGSPGRSAAAAAVTFYVDNLRNCAGFTPCFTTIQGAVDAAGPDTAVEVFPGVYHEAVRIVAKTGLELRPHGVVGPVIAPPAGSDAVQIIQSPGAYVGGFVVDRGGILVAGGASNSPTIEDNFIRSAGGVSFLSVVSCVARRNTVAGGLTGGGGRLCVFEDNVVEGTISFDEGVGCGARNNIVRGNLVRGGDIGFSGRCTEDNLIEANRVDGGGIGLQGSIGARNLIRSNLVRGGVLDLRGNVAANTIEGNFVSGSPTDGIRVAKSVGMGPNTIQRNTAVNNGVCDINEILPPFTPPNVWLENRYVTKCGAAETGAAGAVQP
jgi:hypothetical protein